MIKKDRTKRFNKIEKGLHILDDHVLTTSDNDQQILATSTDLLSSSPLPKKNIRTILLLIFVNKFQQIHLQRYQNQHWNC